MPCASAPNAPCVEVWLDINEVILRRPDNTVTAHYLIVVFCGRWLAGTPTPGDDASAARFVRLEDLDAMKLTENAAAIIRRAWDKLEAGPR